MRGREKFAKFKAIINALSSFYGLLPRKVREWEFVRLRNCTGNIAFARRYALLKTLAKHIGDNVAVYPGVYLVNTQGLKIGNNVSFQPMVYIEAFGGVEIGDDVSIAEGASVFSTTHIFDELDTPIKDQGTKKLPVKIGSNVWIGAKATILGGGAIGNGCIVAAGAVVNKRFPSNMVIGGVPARILKERASHESHRDPDSHI